MSVNLHGKSTLLFRGVSRGAVLTFMLLTATAAATPRERVDLNGTWQGQITRTLSDTPPASGWSDFAVPDTRLLNLNDPATHWWVKRSIAIPASWAGSRVVVVVMGARNAPHVFVDGKLVARRLQGWTPFEVDVTDWVRPGDTHELAVRCSDRSATFDPSARREGKTWGDLSGKVLVPNGGHQGLIGLWDDVYLMRLPRTSLSEMAAVARWREGKRLQISGRVDGAAANLRVRAAVSDGGREACVLGPAAVNGDGTWHLEAAFPDARGWSPEDPFLYTLRVTLESAAGELDRLENAFGFKEIWCEGADFYLNGVKRHLLASSAWPKAQPMTREDIRRNLQNIRAGNNLAFRCHTAPWQKAWLEIADEVGVLIVEEGPLYTPKDDSYAYKDERFWANFREILEGMVRRGRNHASLAMWSIENEVLHMGMKRFDGDIEKKLGDLARHLRKIDPWHPITFESDHDPDGAADVIGLHYPHECPTFFDYPNTCDWLGARTVTGTGGGMLGESRRGFQWKRDKPLYIGEYLWCPQEDYSIGSIFFGDDAYLDRVEYLKRAQGVAWYDQTLAYRRSGVSGTCPWTAFASGGDMASDDHLYRVQKEVYTHVAAFGRDRDTRFFAGDKVGRTFDVFNDSPEALDLTLAWNLAGAEGGKTACSLAPGETRAVRIDIPMPASDAATTVAFVTRLMCKDRTLHAQSAVFRVEPRGALGVPAGTRIALLDPSGSWAGRLAAAGVTVSDLRGNWAATPREGVVLIAPDAWPRRETAATSPTMPVAGGGAADWRTACRAVRAALESGARIVVMEQESLAGFPGAPALEMHASTMCFALGAGHPLLDGLRAEDLKFWRGDNYVAQRQLVRPATCGARSVVVSGGPDSLRHAAVLEARMGRGTVVFVQALAGAKFDTEPAARRLLGNALRYAAGAQAAAGRVALVSETDAFAEAMERIGADFERLPAGRIAASALTDAALVMLHGGGEAIRNAREALEAFMASPKPGVVYWHAPDAATFATLRKTLGGDSLAVAEASGTANIIERAHALLRGVSREDLIPFAALATWRRQITPDTTGLDRIFLPESTGAQTMRIAGAQMRRTGKLMLVGKDGRTLGFHTNGEAASTVTIAAAGTYALWLHASGSPCAGGWPEAQVCANGAPVARVTVTTTSTRAYPLLAALPAEEVELTVRFDNDMARAAGEDRNLFLESIEVGTQPIAESGMIPLLAPSALIVFRHGAKEVALDGVRWDLPRFDREKTERYAGALLANMGASMALKDSEPVTWISPAACRLSEGGTQRVQMRDNEIGFYAAGAVEAAFRCAESGTYAIILRAKASSVHGEWGKAAVSVDGRLVGEAEVASSQPEEIAVGKVSLEAGAHVLKVRFTNDLFLNGKDRNLWVYGVGFRQVAAGGAR